MIVPDSRNIEGRARRMLYRKLGGYHFHRMRLYLRDMQDLMAYKKYKLKEYYTEQLKQYPGAARMIDEDSANEFANYERHFVGILHNSTFLSAYALFESRFAGLCMFAAQKRGIPVAEESFVGDNSVRKCQNFLKANFPLRMKAVKPYSSVLDRHTELRNRIAHHQATIPVSNEALTTFARKSHYIRLLRLRGKKLRPFEIQDRLYIHYFLELAEHYLHWMLMRIMATKKELALLEAEDDQEIARLQDPEAHLEAQQRVLGHHMKVPRSRQEMS
jgi:hypothetical protein